MNPWDTTEERIQEQKRELEALAVAFAAGILFIVGLTVFFCMVTQ